jgi:hypothetical protein
LSDGGEATGTDIDACRASGILGRAQTETILMATKRRKPSPHDTMLDLITGHWVSQLLFVVAKLGVADTLVRGPLKVETIAARVGAHAPSLRRILRALASRGVFAEDAGGRFRLTPLARLLRNNHPGSLRDFILMIVDDYNWQAWGALSEVIKSGASPFEHVHGTSIFAYLRDHPDKEQLFAAAMASNSSVEVKAVVRAYPFGELSKLVDVGGAHGHLLASILRRHKKLEGVLFDLPEVVATAAERGLVTAPALRGRCETVGGDFFEAVPEGADGYLMKHVLHDWDDARCVRILRNCREAMRRDGRVLVAENVVRPGNGADTVKLMDVNMMVAAPGGAERTREEFRALFGEAGLRLKRVISTAATISILEGVRA